MNDDYYNDYQYLLYLPDGYPLDQNKNWPLIIYLHGGSMRGNDPNKLKKYGPPYFIEQGEKFPFIIVSPQLPFGKNWYTDNWFQPWFSEITNKYRVDTDRVYLTGVSLGGEGTWYLAVNHPDVFAAAAPICGTTRRKKQIKEDAYKIKDLPIWVFHGVKDRVVDIAESDEMVEILENIGSNVKYTRYPFAGHGKAHWNTYGNEELYDWFLQHKRNK